MILIRRPIAVIAAVFAISFSSAAWAGPSVITVEIRDYAFVPPVVEIEKGDSVVWINADETPHNILAEDKAFKSPPLDTKEEYRRTFDRTGTYDYTCQLHPHMKGKVVVR
jgi:amicyanin